MTPATTTNLEAVAALGARPLPRFIAPAPAAVPRRSYGLGPFTVDESTGQPRLIDAAGDSWGIFANKRLADETAAALSR